MSLMGYGNVTVLKSINTKDRQLKITVAAQAEIIRW